ncbi:MAG TPA: hypothetical protein VJ697_13045 [Nitrososphaeraceae archaeon]|nr:hypothetical protein [Nitrososphaeraceae archaeon]
MLEIIVSTDNTKIEASKTRVRKISEHLCRRFVEHLKRYYNTETYETILNDLLNCYQKNNTSDYMYFSRINN